MGLLSSEKIDDEQRILNRMSGNTYYSNSSMHETGAYIHEALDKSLAQHNRETFTLIICRWLRKEIANMEQS